MKIIINIASLAAAAGLTLALAGTANSTPVPSSFEMDSGSSQIIMIADDKHMHKAGDNPHHGEKGHVHTEGDEAGHMSDAAHHGEPGHAHKAGEKADDHHDHKPNQ